MRRFAVVNQKGGSGKTTTAVNLVTALGALGRRTLLVDMDPQGSASHWYRLEGGGRGLLDVLLEESELSELIQETASPGVSLVPASNWLMTVEKLLAGEAGAESLLRPAVDRVAADGWDYLLMDCPPTLGLLTVNALVAANEVLIPVEARVLPLHGLAQLLETVRLVEERLNPRLRISGILLSRVDRRTRLAQEISDDLRARFGKLVYKAVIRENIRLAEAPSFGQPILAYAARSPAAEDFRQLAAEVVAQERSS